MDQARVQSPVTTRRRQPLQPENARPQSPGETRTATTCSQRGSSWALQGPAPQAGASCPPPNSLVAPPPALAHPRAPAAPLLGTALGVPRQPPTVPTTVPTHRGLQLPRVAPPTTVAPCPAAPVLPTLPARSVGGRRCLCHLQRCSLRDRRGKATRA